eukprot:gene35171-45544_t
MYPGNGLNMTTLQTFTSRNVKAPVVIRTLTAAQALVSITCVVIFQLVFGVLKIAIVRMRCVDELM